MALEQAASEQVSNNTLFTRSLLIHIGLWSKVVYCMQNSVFETVWSQPFVPLPPHKQTYPLFCVCTFLVGFDCVVYFPFDWDHVFNLLLTCDKKKSLIDSVLLFVYLWYTLLIQSKLEGSCFQGITYFLNVMMFRCPRPFTGLFVEGCPLSVIYKQGHIDTSILQ